MMKIKQGFVMRKVGDSFVAAPVGEESARTRAMIVLNETGAWLWNFFSADHTEEECAIALAEEYEIDVETAKRDAHAFLQAFRNRGMLEE